MSRLHNQSPNKLVARKFRRFVLPVLILIVLIGALITAKRFFVISTLNCEMDGGSCPEAVIAELERLRGQSIFFVETRELEQKLHAALPKAKTLDFEKRPPHTVSLAITSYPSAFFVSVGQHYFLLNEAGHVVDQTDTLPAGEYVISLPLDSLQTGENIDQATFSALLALTTELRKTSLSVNDIVYVSPEEMTLHLANQYTAILKQDDVFSQLATLQRILNEATMGESGHVIDVRFAHPIVRP
ncbi:MAG TPA: cell division protein FtsQ/DivIB [Candidatus Saccharimonadia bacterium]|nr:cell division protein FtsQ/DivIB [Candidatus Saccharimonadia bacterium]